MALADIDPGEVRSVTVDGLKLAVIRDQNGSVHALADRCAHAGARLSHGRLLQKVVGNDVDQYRLTDELILRCPWHGYEYDLNTGRCLADPDNIGVRTYTVTVDEGTVWLERGATPTEPGR